MYEWWCNKPTILQQVYNWYTKKKKFISKVYIFSFLKFIIMFIKENLNDVILRCWIVIPRKLGWTEWVNVTGDSSH